MRLSPTRQAAIAWGVALLASAGVLAPLHAQSWRGELAFVDSWRPAVLVGYEWRTPIGREPPLPEPDQPGPVFATVRNWIFSVMAGGGVTFARVDDRDVSPTALGQIGVLRRLGGALEPRLGLYAFGGAQPEVVGPLLRAEAKDVVGVQIGWGWFTGSSRDGLVVMADVSLALLSDLRR